MNKDLAHLFRQLALTKFKGTGEFPSIDRLSVFIQGEQKGALVFYRITGGDRGWEKFFERAKKSSASILILNEKPPRDFIFAGSVYYSSEKDWQQLQTELCNLFYPVPTNVVLLGITGTNGKTTTVNLTRDLLESEGARACSVGTIGIQGEGGKVLEDLSITTPSFVDIRRLIHDYCQRFDYFIFEVSSHALDQERFHALTLKASAWTNITQDHLDYHKTFEAYMKAKAKLAAISEKLFVLKTHPEVKAALGSKEVEVLKVAPVDKMAPPFFQLPHNWENMCLAQALVQEALERKVQLDWSRLHPPRGRFETLEWQERLVVIDYAHTPDALAKILSATKESFPGRRLICIFGAGGERDPSKRPLMGKCASEEADLVVLTSDNPRGEEPALIMSQIEKGIVAKNKILLSEPSRQLAIEKTLAHSRPDDIIVIAGKGHETYQEVKGVKNPFDDKAVVLEFISHQK